MLALGVFSTTGFCAIATITVADPLPCIPNADPTTCLLNYRTKSGRIVDVADPGISASAWVYSNTCLVLGQKSVAVPGQTEMVNWALSFKRPLLLGSEHRPGMSFETPWFRYDGRTYGYEDCSCTGSANRGGFNCACPFKCKLWVLDGAKRISEGGTEDARIGGDP
ncbi:unnamed protein product [Diplocarpon coronariae]|uniref:Uncharacterized protein n=1 Tax=Diplocarpon coronariae TaxID=2795749 RepID=A0A218YWR3_9HELO|nr:hypothetical protein B2J93_9481 [Marssonina coronariae]